MNELKKVIVFVPAFNEEDSIESVIQQVSDLFPVEKTRDKGFFIQLLIVNDGSTDRTEEIAKYKGIEVISHPRNLGLGAATRTAMENAYEEGADIAIKLDAALQHDPADIEKAHPTPHSSLTHPSASPPPRETNCMNFRFNDVSFVAIKNLPPPIND